MAFFSMILAFFLLIFLALAILTFIGFILLVVGLIKGKKANRRGEKYPSGLVATGAIFLSVPVNIIISIVVFAFSYDAKLDMERRNYNNCVDKWKNEWVSSDTVKEDVMTEFLAAAEAADKGAIMALYSEQIRSKEGFEEQVDEFLKSYPKGLYWEPGTGNASSSGSTDHGMSVETTSVHVVLYRGEERYYVDFGACNENDFDAGKIGLEYFYINSETAEVLEDDDSFDGYPDDEYIMARIDIQVDFETRLIWGKPYKFYPMERTITEQQALDAVRKAETIYELKEILGEPNANKENMDDLVYELEPVNGEPRYMVVSYDDRHGIIYLNGTYFTGTKQENARWLNEQGQFTD